MQNKLKNFRGYSALIIITTVACCFAMVRGLLLAVDIASKVIMGFVAIPFVLIAFLLEPSMAKNSVKDLIKIGSLK